MAYGTKYEFTFNTYSGLECLVEFQLEGYVGGSTVVNAGPEPVYLSWDADADKLFHPIRAANGVFNVLGIDVTEFVSVNETDWKAKVTLDSTVIYEGFISGDDTPQQVIFGEAPIQVNATDGLALLKDQIYPEQTTDQTIYEIINTCLSFTGLTFDLEWFANLWPTGITTGHWGDDVKTRRYFVQKDNQEYHDCYEVLSRVLISMGARIYQSGGRWVIDRPGDFEKFPSGVPGALYDSGGYDSNITLNTVFDELIPISSTQLKTTYRPVQAIKYTFNYLRPILLENADLSLLGSFIGSFVDGSNTVYRYNAQKWTEQNSAVVEIRVVKNTTTDIEVDRYIWSEFKNNLATGALPDAMVTNEFPVDEKDSFSLSFQYRADSDSNFGSTFGFTPAIELTTGARYNIRVAENSSASNRFLIWVGAGSRPFNNMFATLFVSGAGSLVLTEPVTLDVASLDQSGRNKIPIFPPLATNMKFLFHGFNNNTSNLADVNLRINDIQFEYLFKINDQINIIGAFFATDADGIDFKNRISEDIFMGDSPKSLAKGTLYTGAVELTNLWATTPGGSRDQTWGEMQVTDAHNIQGVSRVLLEGDFRGVAYPKGKFEFDFLSGKTFLATRLNISVQSETVNGSFYEVVGDDLPTLTYRTEYIYKVNG